MEQEDWINHLNDLGITRDDLLELVIRQAKAINSCGVEAQIQFLVSQLGEHRMLIEAQRIEEEKVR